MTSGFDHVLASALAAHTQGDLPRAHALYQQALSFRPDDPDALHLFGVLQLQLARPNEAIDLIQRALARRPDQPAWLCNLGEAWRAAGEPARAQACQRQAISLDPSLAPAHANLALALEDAGQLEAALDEFDIALTLDPSSALAWQNKARVAASTGALDAAAHAAHQSIRAGGDSAERRTLLALIYLRSAHLATAAREARAALALDPNAAEAMVTLARSLSSLGQHDEAIDLLRRAAALRPDDADAASVLLYAMHETPLCTPEQIAAEHRAWASRFAGTQRIPRAATRNQRLRIGYVSPDFRRHAVSHFLLPLIENHDRSCVEVFCYSNTVQSDELTARYAALADCFRDIRALSDDAAARQIASDGVDVLIDLAGHTEGNRLGLFARKPSPLQLTYLGYPDTTGLDAIHYRITDAIADPPGQTDTWHTEQLLRLDRCFLCYRPPDAPEVTQREPKPITFGCFNRPSKVPTELLALWARILHDVPGATLLLKQIAYVEEEAQRAWRARFAKAGVDPSRIRFAPSHLDQRQHMGAYADVDIALDTWPYNGTTTTCDALWMGVPVVTLAGANHVSRVSASVLTAVDLPELITNAPEAYVQCAVALAKDLPRLTRLRQTLRPRLHSSPLLEPLALARAIEQHLFTLSRYARGG